MQEAQVSRGIEDRGWPVVESSLPEFDGAQDFDALAFSGHRHFRRVTDPAPGRVEGGILPEAGLVGKNQRPVLGAGFFLRRG
jgi:hypothetical protein